MEKVIRLPLYGDIDHKGYPMLWDLFQSEALMRLRDISLSSTPARFAPQGTSPSRFEHSVAVAYLARLLADKNPDIDKNTLMAACLLHDIGSPPFSHIAEAFMYDILHRKHEEETSVLLAPGRELYQLLRSFDVDPFRVAEAINGEGPLGPLVAGSIDLDNIDNSVHLMHGLGYRSDRYHPTEIIGAFAIEEEGVALRSEYLADIIGWVKTREDLYSILREDTHLSATVMLYRALEFAFAGDHLDEDFFALGESDALYRLAHQSGRRSAKIIEKALRWQRYVNVFHLENDKDDPHLSYLLSSWRERKEFTDLLADELRIPREDLALFLGKNRGEKAIDLPWLGERSEAASALFSEGRGRQRLSVFVLPDHIPYLDEKKVNEVFYSLKDALPEKDYAGHSFL